MNPVLVIGMNRGGTSLITYLLSQHQDLTLVADNKKKPWFAKEGPSKGHSGPYAELELSKSLPLWTKNLLSGEGLLGDTKNISANHITFVDDVDVYKEEFDRLLKTPKRPLLKQVHFCLKLGLLKQMYPKSQMVYIKRDRDEYIKSNASKEKRFSGEEFAKHYDNLTKIINEDLIRFECDFTEINLADIKAKNTKTVDEINRIFNFLNLEKFDIDMTEIRK